MSAQGKEIELKFALADALELEKLSAALGGEKRAAVEQVNHFFDTADLDLNRAKHTLRLREENRSNYLLTAKGPGGSEAGALSERTELETHVDEATAKALLDGARSPLEVLEQALGAGPELFEALRRLAAD
jgi:inorganic triphosphatase YgiF